MSLYHRYALYYTCRQCLDDVERRSRAGAGDVSLPDSGSISSSNDDRSRPKPDAVADAQPDRTGPWEAETAHAADDPERASEKHESEHESTSSDGDGTGTSLDGSETGRAPKRTAACPARRTLRAQHRVLRAVGTALRAHIRRVERQADAAAGETVCYLWDEAGRLNGSGPVRTQRMQRLLGLGWWSAGAADASAAPRRNGVVCPSPLASALDPDDLAWDDEVAEWERARDQGQTRDSSGRWYLKL